MIRWDEIRCPRCDEQDVLVLVVVAAALREAEERGFWKGRSCGGSKAQIDAAVAAIREGGSDAN
jgi:hypothetical protein